MVLQAFNRVEKLRKDKVLEAMLSKAVINAAYNLAQMDYVPNPRGSDYDHCKFYLAELDVGVSGLIPLFTLGA